MLRYISSRLNLRFLAFSVTPKQEFARTSKKPLVCVALGGNALLRRGEPLTHKNQQLAVNLASKALAEVSKYIQLVITHGNGPQVGLLSLQHGDKSPLDLLNAMTEGSIGYMLTLALTNYLKTNNINNSVSCLLTPVIVKNDDVNFKNPTKFIGPVYTKEQIEKFPKEKNYIFKKDGTNYRRVVPSPEPQSILGIEQIRTLLINNNIVIACGGGGIPLIQTTCTDNNNDIIRIDKNISSIFEGVEAVIDKDASSALLADKLDCQGLVVLTDGGGIIPNYHSYKPDQRKKEIKQCNIKQLSNLTFPSGSMLPKIQAITNFINGNNNRWAIIGDLKDAVKIFNFEAGTLVSNKINTLEWY